jgi:putative ribosome biogenesis GTPase RsgA
MNETSAFRAPVGALAAQANQADSEAIIRRVRVDFAAIAARSGESGSTTLSRLDSVTLARVTVVHATLQRGPHTTIVG